MQTLDVRGLKAAIEAVDSFASYDTPTTLAEDCIRAYLGAARRPSPVESGAVAVKALEWTQNWPNEPKSQWVLVREIDRCYGIEPDGDVLRVATREWGNSEAGETNLGAHPTMEAAKAAAQADYEARIRSALVEAPAAGMEAAVEALANAVTEEYGGGYDKAEEVIRSALPHLSAGQPASEAREGVRDV